MRFDVVLVGGTKDKKDGEVIASFDTYNEAYDFATDYDCKHRDDFDPVCGGVTIINERGVIIGW